MDYQQISAALQAFPNHEVRGARELIKAYVDSQPEDALGWYWLSRVSTHPVERARCLKRVLAINPHSLLAAGELAAVRLPEFSPAAARPGAQVLRSVGRWTLLGIALTIFAIVGVATLPLFMGSRTLVILSGSMEPAIGKGALVIARPVASIDLRLGDVIVFSPNPNAQVPVVHRVAGIDERNGTRFYTTRGDANPNADVDEVSLPPTAWRVGYTIPLLGFLLSYAASPAGAILLIVVPLTGLIAYTIWDWFRQRQPSRRRPAW